MIIPQWKEHRQALFFPYAHFIATCLHMYTITVKNEHAQYKRVLGRPKNGARKNYSKPFGHALLSHPIRAQIQKYGAIIIQVG